MANPPAMSQGAGDGGARFVFLNFHFMHALGGQQLGLEFL